MVKTPLCSEHEQKPSRSIVSLNIEILVLILNFSKKKKKTLKNLHVQIFCKLSIFTCICKLTGRCQYYRSILIDEVNREELVKLGQIEKGTIISPFPIIFSPSKIKRNKSLSFNFQGNFSVSQPFWIPVPVSAA